MSAAILVAYATRYGSTQEVAETVATTLREKGLEVAVQPAREVDGLGGYRAVVLGGAIYIGRWHKDARRFLARHREGLAKRPVAAFGLGPLHRDEKEWQEVQAQFDKDLTQFPWLTPISVKLFGGKIDPEKLHFPDSLMTTLPASPLKGMPASDLRDWTEIRAWASDLATKLQPAAIGQ